MAKIKLTKNELKKQNRITSYNVCYTKLLRNADVDIVIIAACGERAGEVSYNFV